MAEQLYYDDIFYETFANENYMIEQDETIYLSKVMPYKWMPRFVDATDASARTLKIYNTVNKDAVDSSSPVENKIVSSLAV